MEFSEIVVKENPGLCRCCLSEGCYKDMGSEYTWMSENEVYADMLLECFDISITQHNEGPNGVNRLICEVCITRLRDACNFKKQVLDSEKKFIDMIGRGDFQPKMIVYHTQMKCEDAPTEEAIEETVEYLDDIDFTDDTEELKDASAPTVSDITANSLPVKGKRGRPKKNVMKTEKKSKIAKMDEKPKSSRAVSKGSKGQDHEDTYLARLFKIRKNILLVLRYGEPRGGQKLKEPDTDVSTEDDFIARVQSTSRPILSPKEKRNIMRNNVLQVLKKSSVMPFRWLKSSYRCFYCYDIFQEASELKSHQENHSGDLVKEQAMSNYWESVVYVDISRLACNLCPEQITDLYDLIDHLVLKHDVAYNKDVGICMVAFKLDNFTVSCLACGASFYTFGPLLHHTNKDHKGTSAILCEVCGQHFKDATLLRLHVKTIHENTGLLCPECGEKFDTRSKLKTHQKNQHDLEKKYKCLVCSQIFQSHYKRSRHMASEHKNRQEIKCLHCPKTFVFRSMMMTHLRDTHLKVRNHICGVCGWKAFNSNRLKNHMYKHSGEKNFKCEVCDKAFTTKKIMRAHFSRMHKSSQPSMMHFENPYVAQ